MSRRPLSTLLTAALSITTCCLFSVGCASEVERSSMDEPLAGNEGSGEGDAKIICGPGTHEDQGICLPDELGAAGASAGEENGGETPDSGLGVCGPGTKLVDGVCVIDEQPAAGSSGAGGSGAVGCVGGASGSGQSGGSGSDIFGGGGSSSDIFGGGGSDGDSFGGFGGGAGAGSSGFSGSSGSADACEDTCDSATTDCDGDGWLVSQGDCCDKVGPCGQTPALQNPGAVEYKGDGVDNDCDGFFDETEKPCDYELSSSPNDAFEYLKALDLCQFTQKNVSIEQRKWGVISAEFTTADGYGYPDPRQRAIRSPKFGDGIYPLRGGSMLVLSSGVAADMSATPLSPPAWPLGKSFDNISTSFGTYAQFPQDWLQANNGKLPTGCSGSGSTGEANDSVMLTVKMRVPTNAHSFSFQSMFMSSEFPEFICSSFNDLFLVLVRNESGKPISPNPPDGNIAFFQTGSGANIKKFPVGINLAGDPVAQKLFSVCDPKRIGCSTSPVDLECALGPDLLKGTGYEQDGTSWSPCAIGGATDWLTVAGNVVPGGIVEIRILIADVGDTSYDSTVLLDSFVWNATPGTPGTN